MSESTALLAAQLFWLFPLLFWLPMLGACFLSMLTGRRHCGRWPSARGPEEVQNETARLREEVRALREELQNRWDEPRY